LTKDNQDNRVMQINYITGWSANGKPAS